MDEQHIAASLLAGPDAVIAADRSGVIRLWNPGAERIFGHTAAEAVGDSLDLIVPERLRERHWQGWRAYLETGHSRYGPDDLLSVPSLRRDGRPLSIEFTIHPVLDVDGSWQGIAATLRDQTPRFTEIRELRQRLTRDTSPPEG